MNSENGVLDPESAVVEQTVPVETKSILGFSIGQKVAWKRGQRVYYGTVEVVILPERCPDRAIYPECLNEKAEMPKGVMWTTHVVEMYDGESTRHPRHKWLRETGVQAVDSFDQPYREEEMPPKVFTCGDRVQWTWLCAGKEVKNEGEVVDVLPPGEQPDPAKYGDIYHGKPPKQARDEVSYVVRSGSNGTGRYYWPKVKRLELVQAAKIAENGEPVVDDNGHVEMVEVTYHTEPPEVPVIEPMQEPQKSELIIKTLPLLPFHQQPKHQSFRDWLAAGEVFLKQRNDRERELARFILEEYSGARSLGVPVTDEHVDNVFARWERVHPSSLG